MTDIVIVYGSRRAELQRMEPDLVRWRLGEGDPVEWGPWTETDVAVAAEKMTMWTLNGERT